MARRSQKIWMRDPRPIQPKPAEKAAIIAACENFITTELKPRFLPEVQPKDHNYPINIHGDWRGGRYRFLQRWRVGSGPNVGEKFDHPFTRLDHMGTGRFDIYWMRHTGQWWPLYQDQSLPDCFKAILEDINLQPISGA